MSERVHELKIWPPFFAAVLVGSKTFEVRKDDRGFRVGDRLLLREYDPALHEYRYTRRSAWVEVTYLMRGGDFGIERGYVVMGIRKIDREAGR